MRVMWRLADSRYQIPPQEGERLQREMSKQIAEQYTHIIHIKRKGLLNKEETSSERRCSQQDKKLQELQNYSTLMEING